MITETFVAHQAIASYRAVPSQRFAGLCGIMAGVAALGYAISFIILKNVALSGLFLMLSGLLSTALLAGIFTRVRHVDDGMALWGLLLGIAGALGAAIHGGYDLANALHPPAGFDATLPNPIDPRGLMTFGATGIATGVIAWLVGQTSGFPRAITVIGYPLAALLLLLYIGRLVILDPANIVIAVPALLVGFALSPLWTIMLGMALRRN